MQLLVDFLPYIIPLMTMAAGTRHSKTATLSRPPSTWRPFIPEALRCASDRTGRWTLAVLVGDDTAAEVAAKSRILMSQFQKRRADRERLQMLDPQIQNQKARAI